MEILDAIIAGLVGTAVITAIMYMGPYMGFPEMDIIGMLGTMFVERGTGAVTLGTIIHFTLGAIFAIIYLFLWQELGLGDPIWWWGIIYGLVHGLLVVAMMPVVQRVHPRPEGFEMGSGTMAIAGMLMGHAIFGLVVAVVYNTLVL